MSFSRAARQLGRRVTAMGARSPSVSAQQNVMLPRGLSTGTVDTAKEAIHNASSNGWAAPAAAAVFVGAGATYYFTMRTPMADSATETPELLDPNQVKGGTAPSKTVPLPDFTATDHTGSQFTLDQIKGDFAMLCFGVTRNFEDAKERLENLAELVRQSDRRSNMQYMKALFVSEEPDQDAPEKMADLLEKYEKKTSRASRIIGLTGPDVNAVRQMVNQFNQKSVTEGKTSVVEAGDPDGSLFLVNPEGQLVAGFKYAVHGVDAKEVSRAIAGEIVQWTHTHPMWHAPKKIMARHA